MIGELSGQPGRTSEIERQYGGKVAGNYKVVFKTVWRKDLEESAEFQ